MELALATGQSALVRVQGNGAEVTLSLVDDGVSLHTVGLNQFRLNPLFLTIPSSSEPRSLTLSILVNQTVAQASTGVQIDVFAASSDDSAIQAWSGVSDALTKADIPFEKRQSRLLDAAALLRGQGNESDALWADFFLAYFTYWYPYDLKRALEITETVESGAIALKDEHLRLAALQLLAAVLIERDDDPVDIARQKFDRAKRIIKEIQTLSTALGRPFQEAWALNNLGIGYYYRKENDLAAKAYREAYQQVQLLGDHQVGNLIISNWVLMNESNGDYRNAIATMESITPTLNEQGTGMLLADNQREIGRLYTKLADFDKAVLHLSRSQKLAARYGDKGAEGRALFSLGIAQLNMGRRTQARQNMELAVNLLQEQGGANEVRDAVVHLASIDRAEGHFERLDQHRALQENFLDSVEDQARFAYEKAQDQLALGRRDSALESLDACINLSIDAPDIQVGHLCTLEQVKLQAENPEPPVELELARRAFAALEKVAPISTSLKAQQLLAEIEFLQGNSRQAMELSESLVTKVDLYRQKLPGIMGAWYWESRRATLDFYFERVMEANRGKHDAAARNLATFSRIINSSVSRNSRNSVGLNPSGNEGFMRIRELLALRDSTRSQSKKVALSNEIDALLLATYDLVSPDSLQSPAEWIEQLPGARTSALIAYYFGPTTIQGWLASEGGVIQIEIPGVDEIKELLKQATYSLRSVTSERAGVQTLDRLGVELLSGFQKELPETLHFLISGPLTGFPVDALRIEGAFLAEHHLVIQNLDLPVGDGELPGFTPGPSLSVFIAGDPVGSSGGMSELAGAREEIESISKIYADSQMTVLKGQELGFDAVQAALAAQPQITHFASHAINNLEYPELSVIVLSDPKQVPGEQSVISANLMPYDLRQLQSQGGMVVLSACSTSGSRMFAFDANMGFVTEFLKSGIDVVVASLWPVSDRQTKYLMIDFYQSLANGSSPSEALFKTKRSRIKSSEANRISDWASFQLYSR